MQSLEAINLYLQIQHNFEFNANSSNCETKKIQRFRMWSNLMNLINLIALEVKPARTTAFN